MRVCFDGGLGDHCLFAQQVPLYTRRGHELTIVCGSDRALLFQGTGAETSTERLDAQPIPWIEGMPLDHLLVGPVWECNNWFMNIGRPPLPYLGPLEELWAELYELRIDLRPYLPAEEWLTVRRFLAELPRPVILLHTMGNSLQETKSIPDHQAKELYKELLDRTPGTIVLLDWDDRVPRLASYRVRHLSDDWERISLPRLFALLYEADLIVGVESGPLHAARFTETPAVGLFHDPGHYPVRHVLPRGRQVHLVTAERTRRWNPFARAAYNIMECGEQSLDMCHAADICVRMLAGPRFLAPEKLGADVLLQDLLRRWRRDDGCGLSLNTHDEPEQCFEAVARHLLTASRRPVVMAPGYRATADLHGEGFARYLWALLLSHVGGRLIVVDPDQRNIVAARQQLGRFSSPEFICDDAARFLSGRRMPVDLLLLDGELTPSSALRLVQIALPCLHRRSVVLCGNTVYCARSYRGLGEQVVPCLLERGWNILHSSRQTALAASLTSSS